MQDQQQTPEHSIDSANFDPTGQKIFLMNEILCERPYALYSFFNNLERNPFYLRKAYWRIKTQDIEELMRCAPDQANMLIRIFSSKEEKTKFKKGVWFFFEIKNELKQFVQRLINSPQYQDRMKAKHDTIKDLKGRSPNRIVDGKVTTLEQIAGHEEQNRLDEIEGEDRDKVEELGKQKRVTIKESKN